jgi:lysophospholipid acyltransferase (LPLAT)-like uncharacterized protein
MAIHHHPPLIRLGGLTVSTYVRSWMGMLDYQVAYYDHTVDPVFPDFAGPVIVVFWHEYLMAPFYLRGRSNTAILASRHADADWLSEAARHLGFETVRGSTSRGGGAALLELLRKIRKMNLGLTPDGPRGPRRRLEQGPIYLSSKLGVPLVPWGFGYDRPWRLPTWDRFAIPRPFSRARLVVGPRLKIPTELDREGMEYYRVRVERLLTRLTLEAEAWAEAGTRKTNQRPLRREPGAQRYTRIDRAHASPAPRRGRAAKTRACERHANRNDACGPSSAVG